MSGGRPPSGLAELVQSFCTAAEDLFGVPVYARRLLAEGELEAEWQDDATPLAEFDLHAGGALLLNRSLAADLRQVVRILRGVASGEGAATPSVVAFVKDRLTSLLHEVVHAIGPDDAEVAATDWWTAHRYPHANVVTEGLAELAAQLFIDDVLDASGVLAVIPALSVVPLQDRPYPGPAAAMRALVGGVSARTRRDLSADPAHPRRPPADVRLRAEVAQMAGEGTGDRPVAQMVLRLMRAESLDLLPRPQFAAGFSALIAPVDRGLDAIGRDRSLRGDAERSAAIALATLGEMTRVIEGAQRHLNPRADRSAPSPASFRAQAAPVQRRQAGEPSSAAELS